MNTKRTAKIPIAPQSIGSHVDIISHTYGPAERDTESCYIQAALHADELPGLLVTHHLTRLLDKADGLGLIKKKIVLVPYANPVGLGQVFLGTHIGRFSAATGVNFNRDSINVTSQVIERLKGLLVKGDKQHNVRLIRKLMSEEIEKVEVFQQEKALKKELFRLAAVSDIVLDLHCDNNAVMHMYTHDRLWPQMKDLAAHLDSKCHLLAPQSGGNPFDEACSCPWATFMDSFPDDEIGMACQAVTVELRGQLDVSDELAVRDAKALFRFLVGRGYIDKAGSASIIDPLSVDVATLIEYCVEATPLTGVDMIEATRPGILVWKVTPGEMVAEGQVLGEIVEIADVSAATRTPIIARTKGIVFGMKLEKLSVPGDTIIKIAGRLPLPWREGNLLTSR